MLNDKYILVFFFSLVFWYFFFFLLGACTKNQCMCDSISSISCLEIWLNSSVSVVDAEAWWRDQWYNSWFATVERVHNCTFYKFSFMQSGYLIDAFSACYICSSVCSRSWLPDNNVTQPNHEWGLYKNIIEWRTFGFLSLPVRRQNSLNTLSGICQNLALSDKATKQDIKWLASASKILYCTWFCSK